MYVYIHACHIYTYMNMYTNANGSMQEYTGAGLYIDL